MSKITGTLILAVVLFLAACSEKKEEKPAAESPTPSIALPFDFKLHDYAPGNPEHVKTILQGSWKDWQDNNLANMKSWLADSITIIHSDRKVVVGVDSVAAHWQRGRSMFTSIQPTIDAAVALHDKNTNEDWVLIWATEVGTHSNGKVDTVSVMESWRINKEGKADWMIQYDNRKRK